MARVLALRGALFRGNARARDRDAFDARCRHLMVEDRGTGALLCTCRLLHLPDAARVAQSYAAQFYDLSRLARHGAPMLEVGRFCLAPGARGADVVRLAWSLVTRTVLEEGIAIVFGCVSLAGTDPAPHRAALARLAATHPAPPRLAPGRGGGETFSLDALPAEGTPVTRAPQPALLRAYLSMGGWIGGHGVIDRDLGTIHVFTAVEVAAIPPVRARLLVADARTAARSGWHSDALRVAGAAAGSTDP